MSNDLERTIRANLTPRSKRLDRLERYVSGTQYEGLAPWMKESSTPTLDRAPCVVYPAARIAIDSHVSLVLGNERFPTITSRPQDDEADDADDDNETGLDEESSEALDYLVRQVLRQARLKTVSRKLLADAMTCGTAVSLVSVRNGKLCVEHTRSKWCEPKFATDGTLESLEIRYPYKQEYFDLADNKKRERVMMYRRVLTQTADTVYKPAVAVTDGSEPTWQVDTDLTVEHGLGFVPAVWYKFNGECGTPEDIDGEAIHAHLLDEMHALNVALSQRHKAAVYAGDPQIVETGVDDQVKPAPDGQTARIIHEPADKGYYESRVVGGPSTARRKGPGVVWRYPSPDSKVTMMTLPGDALTSIDEHAKDLRNKLAESLNILFFETQEMGRMPISGIALTRLMARQTNYCDTVRDDFEHGCLLPLVDMCLRLVATVTARGQSVALSGLQRAGALLAEFLTPAGWVSPDLSAEWPPYFTLTADDEKSVVDLVNVGLQTGVITKQRALAKLADVFGIVDLAHELEELQEDEVRKLQLPGPAGSRVGGAGADETGMREVQSRVDGD